jgi:hypothetical protein
MRLSKEMKMNKIISIIVASLFTASAFAATAATPVKKAGQNVEKHTVQGMDNTNRGGFARNYGLAGCGLGSQVMGAKDGQIFAATTNGTLGNQTFGITFGTSNCVGSPTVAKADRMDRYVVANKIQLADDIARGEGETITGLAQIMNCSDASNLGSKLQSKFTQIFESHDLVANEITDRIITVVGQDRELSVACGVTVSSL